MPAARLERDMDNKAIAGVAAGLAHYLDVDVALVRVAFVLLAFAGGVGIIAYIALLVLMPEAPSGQNAPPSDLDTEGYTPGDINNQADWGDQEQVAARRRQVIGIVLVVVGAVFLLVNLGAFDWFNWDVLWPVILILIGVALIVRQVRQR